MKVAVLQNKPRKGDFQANLAEVGRAFAQLAAEERPYDLVVMPEAALTGYFLEGAVYGLSQTAAEMAETIGGLWRERVDRGRYHARFLRTQRGRRL